MTLDAGIELDSLNHIRTLVAAGHGFAALSHSAVLDDLATGRLAAAPLGRPVIRRPIYLVRSPPRAVTRSSARVENLLVAMLQGMALNGTRQAEWIIER
ncbi:hypothetical protein KPL78_25710 [Roseomonas sp. HJA6]|uniref:LysR substrate-binding domain-containing protein n=1 Tax=Roseomonas alba TaxID=2846776 RepID=A0ABS7AGU7_9PROT|nr:hypothetical protein [Neoroseomonas alba]